MASTVDRSNRGRSAGTRRLVVLATLAVGVPAFLLGRIIWPDTTDSIVVPAHLVPYFALPSLLEALAFGAGAAFLIANAGASRRAAGQRRLAAAAYWSTAWLLMAWWPH